MRVKRFFPIKCLLFAIVVSALSSCKTAAPRLDYQEIVRAAIRLDVDIDLDDFHPLYIESARWIGVPYRYGGNSLRGVDCSGLATLAETCRQIFSSHSDQMEQLDGSGIQRYFRYNDSWFYDLKDIIANSGADETELDLLDAAIDDCIIYRAATEKFISIDIERYSGFSMYLPSRGTAYLDSFYSDLAWNRATGLVQ